MREGIIKRSIEMKTKCPIYFFVKDKTSKEILEAIVGTINKENPCTKKGLCLMCRREFFRQNQQLIDEGGYW